MAGVGWRGHLGSLRPGGVAAPGWCSELRLAQAASGGAVPEAAVPVRALRFLFRGT